MAQPLNLSMYRDLAGTRDADLGAVLRHAEMQSVLGGALGLFDVTPSA